MDGNDSYLSGWYILACIYMIVVIIISVLVVRITSKPDRFALTAQCNTGCRQNLGHGPWATLWATLWATQWATLWATQKH